MKKFLFELILLFVCFDAIAEISHKNKRKEYFSQHDLCESEIIKAENENSMPDRLLMAIATVESGKAMDMKSAKRPWPWTVCAGGKGYHFSTKSAAIASVKKLIAQGVRNIDVGCMQINLFHHSKAFRNLEEAFTPRNNVKYGAKYFLDLKKQYGSWTHAVGYYHSRTESLYKKYCMSVFEQWQNVKNRKINMAPEVQLASSKIKSNISFLPPYYSAIDSEISKKLHELGRKTIRNKKIPKFFAKL